MTLPPGIPKTPPDLIEGPQGVGNRTESRNQAPQELGTVPDQMERIF
jgi:hypothetical protein